MTSIRQKSGTAMAILAAVVSKSLLAEIPVLCMSNVQIKVGSFLGFVSSPTFALVTSFTVSNECILTGCALCEPPGSIYHICF